MILHLKMPTFGNENSEKKWKILRWGLSHCIFRLNRIKKYNFHVHAIMHFRVMLKMHLLPRHINLVSETSELILLHRSLQQQTKKYNEHKSENLCHGNIRVSNEIPTPKPSDQRLFWVAGTGTSGKCSSDIVIYSDRGTLFAPTY